MMIVIIIEREEIKGIEREREREREEKPANSLEGRLSRYVQAVLAQDVHKFGHYVAPRHKFCLTDLTVSKFARKYDVLF
jgi:hypothetical protein